MIEEVEKKLKRKNKILFSRESACLRELVERIRLQKHRTLVLWAFECVKTPLALFESRYPNEARPRTAVELCHKWAQGDIKMPVAKRAILDCHGVCKEMDDPYGAALCHAIGQGVSTVHVETHAIGLPIYELSAIVINNREAYQEKLDDKILYYIDTLCYFQEHLEQFDYPWADFLLREDVPNKEDVLWKEKLEHNRFR